MAVAAYARALRALLPPSRLWRDDADAVISETLLASADELERVDGRGQDLLREADPPQATELLPDYERVLGLTASGTTAQRRARVVAMLIRRQRYRPEDFRSVLSPLLGLAPADIVVIERTRAQAIAMGDGREIFRFFIYRNPSLPGSYDLAAAQAIVDAMKPSHTVGHVVTSVGFKCDDPYSLCDRDVLGV